MKRLVACLVAATALAVSSCITRPAIPTYYYTLDYLEETERPELFRSEPFDVTVFVSDAQVSGALTRPQLVRRGLGPQFEYLQDRLWGVELSDTVSELIVRRLMEYRLVSRVDRDIRREPADYEIRTSVSSMEYVSYENTRRAVLRMELTLWDVDTERPTVRHRVREDQAIFGDDVATFVTAVNRMLHQGMDRFLGKVVQYLETGEPVLGSDRSAAGGEEESDQPGVLLLPALVAGENQPYYTIVGEELRRSEQFGDPVDLPAGVYTVLLGSGPTDRRIRLDRIEVSGRRRTVVEPIWAAMTVSVIDENRDPARVRYDVYDAETGRNFGGRISRSEALLPNQTVWILRPGKYKLVLNNRPFNTLQDFVTVNLVAGRGEDLTIVVDLADEEGQARLVGAGNVAIDEPSDEDSPLGIASALNGTLSFTADNEAGPGDFQVAYFLDSEIDTELTYEAGPLRYDLRNTVALGFNATERAPLTLASDELSIRNTLVYSFTDIYGLYARANASSTIFGNRLVPDDPVDYVTVEDGDITQTVRDARVIRLSPPFFPISLQEGVGLNVNAVQTEAVDLGIRAGIGATQALRYEVYEETGSQTIEGTDFTVYEPVRSEVRTGFEISAFGTIRLPFDTSVSTSVELFTPFTDPEDLSLQWETVANVVLVDNISLYYRFTLGNTRTAAEDPHFVQDHGVFLRLNYLIREPR